MINWKITFRETGFSKDYFLKYPKSQRLVYAICDKCGKIRWSKMQAYRDICHNCFLTRDVSDETRQKMSDKKKGSNHPLYGKHHTKETKDKLSKINIGKHCGELNFMYGKHHTNKSKEKISKVHKGKIISEETKEKMRGERLCLQGINHPLFGISQSLETRIKSSCTRRGISIKDFDEFTNRNHVLSESKCIKINQRFKGSEMHHIMSGIVIYIPKYLHQSIRHNMKTGKNMLEINKLAMSYLVGEY